MTKEQQTPASPKTPLLMRGAVQLKTIAGWEQSGLSFYKYFQRGDVVDAHAYYHFLEVVPPATNTGTLMQVGEPSSHVRGEPTYSTFEYVGGRSEDEERWRFCGDCFKGKRMPPTPEEHPA